ncbi:MAG: phosphodiester glycosidase family protein [Synergistaceae bacterium]|nr:phosphodiester glycosidase family protein [Synergistaceae bacterium]MBP9975958.1 phosphodiester glycosidase family protein [Synergistaceae bacterium]MDD4750646.1 phosphodiester glycosidase family protein [Synergistaceae bacterium]MDD4838305.1 phosphodiester glycosidase family protein [Synergistaceae bacterium]
MSSEASFAITKDEVLPHICKSLGHSVPKKYLTDHEGNLTNSSAIRLALESMGWGFVITVYDQITILPEWSDMDSITEISKKISPPLPSAMTDHLESPFAEENIKTLTDWLDLCKKKVSWKDSFSSEGTTLTVFKHGIGNPAGPANGDLKKGMNEPLFAAMVTVDMDAVNCQIATAVMVGANKAPLATIAVENYGVIGGINGGYFAGAKPIGVLRRQGHTDNAKFWPQRSAFGWNENGETIFIDGKEVASISSDRRFDKYTEMLQAGPLLLKNGEYSENTENIRENVLNMRHPRTIVGTDGKRVMWAVVDGRDNMHSVGATIEETRKVCKWLGMTTALNLDGGGSSSLWWRGNTFSLPSNSNDTERPIPYGVLIFREGSGVRQ